MTICCVIVIDIRGAVKLFQDKCSSLGNLKPNFKLAKLFQRNWVFYVLMYLLMVHQEPLGRRVVGQFCFWFWHFSGEHDSCENMCERTRHHYVMSRGNFVDVRWGVLGEWAQVLLM